MKNKFDEYNVFNGKLSSLSFIGKTVINTINQYSFCVSEYNPAFKKALLGSDVLLPDGIGIVLALKAASNRTVKKISGADLHKHLLKKLNDEGGSCFYLGSSDQTLKKIDEHLKQEYPNIKSAYFSPPFKADFTDGDNEEMISRINSHQPDVLFVGMTAPKQEIWIDRHKHQINANVICAIGAVFDFYAGTVKRPDDVWINLGLEWFVRLCKEPKRMWKRYIYYGPIFMAMLMKEMVKVDWQAVTHSQRKVL